MSGLIKHFKNTMKGIPQLTNNWGAMIRLLDAVLVTGFNNVAILGLTKSSASSITALISLGSEHGFIDRQVVRITGSTNGWDGDYKVLSVDSNSITIECSAAHPQTINGLATCYTAPLDFEIVHQTPTESNEPKRAYRSTDPESLGLILLVHDFCVSGAATNGAKFAKVGVVSDMSDIDTIIGIQMPFNEDKPNLNWGWDGTTHGWAKWYYAFAEESSAYLYYDTLDTTTPANYERNFRLVGDSTSVALVIRNYCAYGFLEFDDHLIGGRNLALYAEGLHSKTVASQSTGKLTYGRGGLGCLYKVVGSSNEKCQLWYNENGFIEPKIAGFPIHASVAPSGATSLSYTVSSGQALQIKAYIDKPILDGNGNFRGVIPFYKINISRENSEKYTDNGLMLQRYYSGDGDYWFALNLENR